MHATFLDERNWEVCMRKAEVTTGKLQAFVPDTFRTGVPNGTMFIAGGLSRVKAHVCIALSKPHYHHGPGRSPVFTRLGLVTGSSQRPETLRRCGEEKRHPKLHPASGMPQKLVRKRWICLQSGFAPSFRGSLLKFLTQT